MSGWEAFANTFFDFHDMGVAFPALFSIGLRNTLILSAAAMSLGLTWGLLLSILLVSRRRILRIPAFCYVDVFRGLPAILTIYLVGQGLPIAGFTPFGRSPYPYAILAIGMIQGAYISEIFRSGIQSVDRGQMEAARSLGMPYLLAMRLVVVPQGIRHVLPALMNQFIITVKETSLVYLLGLFSAERDLFSVGQDHTSTSGTLSALVAAGFMYCLITIPLTHLVNHLDKRLREGPRLTRMDDVAKQVALQGQVNEA